MNIFLTLKGGLSGFVEGDPELDPVPELCEAQPGVLLEPVCHLSLQPAAAVLQGLGKVPVVQRHGGGDPGLQEGVDKIVVVIYPGLVLLSHPERKHTAPANGKPDEGHHV